MAGTWGDQDQPEQEAGTRHRGDVHLRGRQPETKWNQRGFLLIYIGLFLVIKREIIIITSPKNLVFLEIREVFVVMMYLQTIFW